MIETLQALAAFEVIRPQCTDVDCMREQGRDCANVATPYKWPSPGNAVAPKPSFLGTPSRKKAFWTVRASSIYAVTASCRLFRDYLAYWNVTDGWGARLAHAYSRKCDVVNRGVSPSVVRTRRTHACVCVVA